MDRAGDLRQSGDAQQGGGCFLLRDGSDGGSLHLTALALTAA